MMILTLGEVVVWDAMQNRQVKMFAAHKGTLSGLALNAQGTLLATASDRGTIIRVFKVNGISSLLF